ncbi:hypothetical protein Tco_1301698 [Tanacetum coccineum]
MGHFDILPQTPVFKSDDKSEVQREEEQVFLDDLARLRRLKERMLMMGKHEALTKNLNRTEKAVTRKQKLLALAVWYCQLQMGPILSNTTKFHEVWTMRYLHLRIFMKMLLMMMKKFIYGLNHQVRQDPKSLRSLTSALEALYGYIKLKSLSALSVLVPISSRLQRKHLLLTSSQKNLYGTL